MAYRNDKNYPEPTGEECTYCDGLGRHKKNRAGAIICDGEPPYCILCKLVNGDCPECHGTGKDRTH